jgi:hypothetical protein
MQAPAPQQRCRPAHMSHAQAKPRPPLTHNKKQPHSNAHTVHTRAHHAHGHLCCTRHPVAICIAAPLTALHSNMHNLATRQVGCVCKAMPGMTGSQACPCTPLAHLHALAARAHHFQQHSCALWGSPRLAGHAWLAHRVAASAGHAAGPHGVAHARPAIPETTHTQGPCQHISRQWLPAATPAVRALSAWCRLRRLPSRNKT